MTGRCHTCKAPTQSVRMRGGGVVHVDGPSNQGGILTLQVSSTKWIDGHSAALNTDTLVGEVRLARHYCTRAQLQQSAGFIPGT